MTQFPLPTPEQISAYLEARGWHVARPMKLPGRVYALDRRTDSGRPIELFVPFGEMDWDDAASAAFAVVDTLCALERRGKQAVLADLLATEVTAPPRAPEPVG